MIEKVSGVESAPHIVQLSGNVSGRESRPDQFCGYAVRYASPTAGDCFKFWPGDAIRDVTRNVYAVDGVLYYVAGWQGTGGGSADRAEDGSVLLHSYSPSQSFMPRRCVFLRIVRTDSL